MNSNGILIQKGTSCERIFESGKLTQKAKINLYEEDMDVALNSEWCVVYSNKHETSHIAYGFETKEQLARHMCISLEQNDNWFVYGVYHNGEPVNYKQVISFDYEF